MGRPGTCPSQRYGRASPDGRTARDDSVGARSPERDVLLATKLHQPPPRPGFVPRPRLLEQLSKGTAAPLTLVCAPAGFGKTSLLAGWASTSAEPVAWPSLDRGDSDPARFWRYVAPGPAAPWPPGWSSPSAPASCGYWADHRVSRRFPLRFPPSGDSRQIPSP